MHIYYNYRDKCTGNNTMALYIPPQPVDLATQSHHNQLIEPFSPSMTSWFSHSQATGFSLFITQLCLAGAGGIPVYVTPANPDCLCDRLCFKQSFH